MFHPHTGSTTLDGRQTSGRKGVAYDWQALWAENLDGIEISDLELAELLADTPA